MNKLSPQAWRQRQTGVTLIELMIVVVIVAILATIAVPGYRHYVQRAHRTEAKTALLNLQTKQESYYLQHNEYADNAAIASVGGGTSKHGVYTITLATAADGQSYTATAAPTAGGGTNGVTMTDDTDCATITLTSTGVKGSSPSSGCW